jgi:CelD/BcsL family acetyltransferase involved in cellulose biosynthesis
LVTVRDEAGMLIGVGPFMTSFWHGSPLRRLSFLGTGVTDYNDVIAEDGLEADVCARIYDFLATSNAWHVGDFQHLRQGGIWRLHPPQSAGAFEYSDHTLELCPYLPFPSKSSPDRWAELLKGYSKKVRSHIGYYERRLKAIFEVEAGFVSNPKELDDAMSSLFELHRRRWNKRWLPGVLGGSRIQKFHREIAADFLSRGWLRLHYLMLDGEYQALLYCFAFGDRTCYYQGGFEPTLAKHSLGSVLTANAIRTAVGEGRAEFDFLRGDEPYKERWTQGNTRFNIRRLVARKGTSLLTTADVAHRIENSIEMRFKDFMHHVYSKEQPQKAQPADQKGESGD